MAARFGASFQKPMQTGAVCRFFAGIAMSGERFTIRCFPAEGLNGGYNTWFVLIHRDRFPPFAGANQGDFFDFGGFRDGVYFACYSYLNFHDFMAINSEYAGSSGRLLSMLLNELDGRGVPLQYG
ncbi:MAG: hypothetical protein ACU826_12620 [Gammaproteobacteria bacterium]